MKKIFKYTVAIACAILSAASVASADDAKDAVKLTKTLTDNGNGTYKIHLESYVTGASVTTVTKTTKPCDIVLVLDVSGSMAYKAIESTTKVAPGTYLDTDDYKYLIVKDGVRYFIKRTPSGNSYNRKYTWEYGTRKEDTSWGTYSKVGSFSTDQNYRVSASDEIYTYTETSRIVLLRTAASKFVAEIYDKSKGADGIANTADDVSNRLSIVTFSPKLSKKHCDYDQQNGSTWYGAVTQSINGTAGLVDVISNKTSIETIINGLSADGGTLTDGAMAHAQTVLANANPDHNKVVVLFTDGTPGLRGWDGAVAARAVNIAKSLKDNNTKIFTVGIFDQGQDNYKNDNIPNFMNGVSSNYETATASNNTWSNLKLGTKNTDGVQYMQVSDGANLSKIFEDIAQSSATTGGETIELTDTKSYVQDVMSSNFSLPDGVTKDDIKVWVEKVKDYDEATKTYSWEKYTGSYPSYNVGTLTPVISTITTPNGETRQAVTVKGYNFSLDDEWNKDSNGNNTTIKNAGNWVGPRKIESQNYYYGNKLCIEFNVVVNPDYEGGYGVPSNDMISGVYTIKGEGDSATSEMVKPFDVPVEDFPSICIIKEGLEIGESAVFKVVGLGDEKTEFNVVLTQRATAMEGKYPCYAVIKGIAGNQQWKVTETNWSWTYAPETGFTKEITHTLNDLKTAGTTKEAIADGGDLLFHTAEDAEGIFMGKVVTTSAGVEYAIVRKQTSTGVFEPISETSPATNGAVVVVYRFNNKKSTSGLPARGEAYAHNKFKGGTATSGGTETGGNEEEDI